MSLILFRIGLTAVCVAAGVVMYVYMNRSRSRQREYRYSSSGESFERDESKICSICLGEYSSRLSESVVLPCKHKFHRLCISIAFAEKNFRSCPLCRRRVNQSFILSNHLDEVLSPSDEIFDENDRLHC